MEIKTDITGNIDIISIIGRVEMINIEMLREKIFTIIENSESGVLIDLKALEYINSAGLGILIRIAKVMETRKRPLVFSSLKENIFEIFKIAGFTNILTIFPTQEEAEKFLN
ncbi:MAG: STAS domain-containing protein [Candidatus Aminicenantes bacterium]|nr:STAS domain-containing protein [Candidatus Aminicenantes bacterium]